MAIPIQCPECHKKYQAPDHMAGKRVKCKHCAVVFLIAADARSADAGLDLSALDELNAMSETGKRDAVKRGAAGEDIDSLFNSEYPSEGAPRTNKLYIFPMSRHLDLWLPPVLLAVGLIWMVREAFDHNESGRTWVGFFRAGLFVLAFFASVFPFTWMGFRAASGKMNYELPPRPGLRAMGVYAVPFALACAMWMILGGVSGLLIGLLIGAVVALPLQFLLFRLLPREAPVTFGYSTGSYLLAIVVAAAAAFALNLMLVGTLRATKTEHALASSPFGPEFRWDGPVEQVKEQIARGDTGPDGPATDEAPATSPTTAATTGPSTSVGPTTRIVAATGPSVPSERDVVRPSDPGKGVAAVTPPAEGHANERPVNPGIVKPEGIVAELKVIVAGGFKNVIHPAIPAPRAAVVRDGRPGHDHLELWDTDGQKKLGEFDVPRAADGNRYALSPDGELLCFVTDFPRLAMQVWSFGAGKFLRQIDLEAGDGEPRMVGFSAPDQLVLQRNRNGQTSLQVWNLKAARQRPVSFSVPAFEVDPSRYAFSPDGSAIAFIVQGAGGADLESYTLATGRPIKQMPIVEVNWNNNVNVAGLAYTPDSQRIAAVFADGQGAGFFVAWPASGRGGKALVQQYLPIGVNLPAQHAGFGGPLFEGRAFHWLDKGHAWLLYGNSVFDADTGAMLASLNLPGVRSQSATPDGNTCYLVRADEFAGLQFAAVKLDIAGARQRVVGGAKPAARQ